MLNFQLNRWHSLGYARDQDMRDAGAQLADFDDWQPVMRRLARTALDEGRVLNAAFYYRAAEFLVPPGDPEKGPLYDRFVELFEQATSDAGLERLEIPYQGSSLPAFRLRPRSGEALGVVVMHGGFDSLVEEFWSFMSHLADRGYDAIAFDGQLVNLRSLVKNSRAMR